MKIFSIAGIIYLIVAFGIAGRIDCDLAEQEAVKRAELEIVIEERSEPVDVASLETRAPLTVAYHAALPQE